MIAAAKIPEETVRLIKMQELFECHFYMTKTAILIAKLSVTSKLINFS